jgi:hypothetical protein
VVQAYITGLLTVIVIVAVLNAVGLLILGVRYAIFFAVFASVLAVIPYIGILVGAALPALMTLVETGSPLKAGLVIGVFVFVQFLEGNFITPTITGSKVSINPMAAIIALILGRSDFCWATWPRATTSRRLAPCRANRVRLKDLKDSGRSSQPAGSLRGLQIVTLQL